MSKLSVIESCEGCGLCCTTMGVPHFFGHLNLPGIDPIWKTVPPDIKNELQEFIDDGGAELGEPCFWYDSKNKSCKHYEHRPQLCRDFEMGNPHCLRLRRQKGIK